MSIPSYIYTRALDKSQALVTSATDTTVIDIQEFVLGDTVTIPLYFTNGTALEPWSGDATYGVAVGLGRLGNNPASVFSSVSATAITNGFSAALPITGTDLYAACHADWFSGRSASAWWLQVRVTDPAGFPTTYLELPVIVRFQVLPLGTVPANTSLNYFTAAQTTALIGAETARATAANIESGRTSGVLYVDAVNGDDSTAIRGNRGFPFLTFSAANAASLAGDTIHFFNGTYIAGKTLLKDYITLEGESRSGVILKLAANTSDYFITNADYTAGGNGITIKHLTIDGNGDNQTPFVRYTSPVFLKNTDKTSIIDVTIKNPIGFSIHLPNAKNFLVRDIYFDQDIASTRLNQDGLHINGPASNGLIENTSGFTNDDQISICATDGIDDWGHGDISNITIRNVYCPITTPGASGVRINSATGGKITNVTVDGIYGAFAYNALDFSCLPGSGASFSGIRCSGISAHATAGPIVRIQADIDSASLDYQLTCKQGDNQQIGSIESGWTVNDLAISGIVEDYSTSGNGVLGFYVNGAAMKSASFNGFKMKCATCLSQSFIDQHSGIMNVSVNGCTGFNVRNPVILSMGSAGGVLSITGGVYDYSSANSTALVYMRGPTPWENNITLSGVSMNNTRAVAYEYAVQSGYISESGCVATNTPTTTPIELGAGGSFRVRSTGLGVNAIYANAAVLGDRILSGITGSGYRAVNYEWNGSAWMDDMGYAVPGSTISFSRLTVQASGGAISDVVGTTEADLILNHTGATTQYRALNLISANGMLSFRRLQDNYSSVLDTPFIFDFVNYLTVLKGSQVSDPIVAGPWTEGNRINQAGNSYAIFILGDTSGSTSGFGANAWGLVRDPSGNLLFMKAGATKGTFTGSGDFSATSFTGPLIGNASTATALATPRTINGVSFDGTAGINCTDEFTTVSTPTTGSTLTGSATVGTELLEIEPAGTIAALTINLESEDALPIGTVKQIAMSQIITALTIAPSGAGGGSIKGTAVTDGVVNGSYAFKKTASKTWRRIY